MAHPSAWDATQPPGTQSIGSGDDRLRELKLQIIDRMKPEHFASDGSETDDSMYWKHLKSAGRMNYGLSGSLPTATSGIDGAIYLETDTNKIKQCKTTSWVQIASALHQKSEYQYATGYVKVSSGSGTVLSSGADFVAGGISTNDIFIAPDSNYYKITNRNAATLTITPAYLGGSTTSNTYLAEFKRHNLYLPIYTGSLYNTLNMQGYKVRNIGVALSTGDALSWHHRSGTIASDGHATSSINLTMLQRAGTTSAVDITSVALGGVKAVTASVLKAANTQDVSLGWEPQVVYVHRQTANAGSYMKTSSDGTSYAKQLEDGSYPDDAITINTSGFTMGAELNNTNQAYIALTWT